MLLKNTLSFLLIGAAYSYRQCDTTFPDGSSCDSNAEDVTQADPANCWKYYNVTRDVSLMRLVKKTISMMMHTIGVHILMMWIVETDPAKIHIIVQLQQLFQQRQRTVVHLNKRLTALQQDQDIGRMSP